MFELIAMYYLSMSDLLILWKTKIQISKQFLSYDKMCSIVPYLNGFYFDMRWNVILKNIID